MNVQPIICIMGKIKRHLQHQGEKQVLRGRHILMVPSHNMIRSVITIETHITSVMLTTYKVLFSRVYGFRTELSIL